MEELNKTMYFGAKGISLQAAKQLRDNMTFHEKLLWEKLCRKQINGVRFRRQHPIDFFIADFYCHEARLVIEIDGESHISQKDYDDGRSGEMEKYYIKVLRFKNEDVEKRIDDVVECIRSEVETRIQSPSWGI